MTRQIETIRLGEFEYAKVSARLLEFLADNPKCSIETTCEFKEGWALFRAIVTAQRGTFTGHSLGKVGATKKQFEKQETIAVGRALAFAGYLSSGEIASFEEMDDADLLPPNGPTTDLMRAAIKKIESTKTREELSAQMDRIRGTRPSGEPFFVAEELQELQVYAERHRNRLPSSLNDK